MGHTNSLDAEINVSKVIHEKRWVVLRMLTRLKDFAKFMPNVKNTEVLERTRNTAVTRWNVEFNKIPITWVEKDTFDFKNFAIHFQAIEGDVEKLEGSWKLKQHPEGTEVEAFFSLRIGIPHLETLIIPLFRQTVRENFRLMLDAMEDRLISERYRSFKQGVPRGIHGFAVIGHPYNFNHLVNSLRLFGPDFKVPSREFLGKVFEITPSYKLFDIPTFRSGTGRVTRGCVIICTIVPDMLELSLDLVFAKVVEACRVAQRSHMGIVCLGGFTSIAGERFGKQISEAVDVPVTTGNTYTAGLALEGVYTASGLMGLDLNQASVTVIGGAGDIGSACARVLAQRVRSIILTGRNLEKLKEMQGTISREGRAEVRISLDNNESVAKADVVISAASVSQSIVDVRRFKPGAIVCDVGYPKNISYSEVQRDDILVFSGGLAESPQEVELGFNLGQPSKKIVNGCSAEAVLLDLDNRYENFSTGRGNITKEKIDTIMQISKKHGFKLAPFFWGHRTLGEKEIREIRKRVKA